jgi:DNA-binding winged helix-turn-helix (wHTH) protein/TolB-like protein
VNTNIYRFGEYLLDLNEKRLLRNGQTIPLQPKVYELLVFFVERHGELISRADLMGSIWKDTFVEESNIRFCIHSLRKALGKDENGGEFLETVPKSGYRFVTEVTEQPYENIILEDSEAITSLEKTENTRFGNRKWLVGAGVFVVVGMLLAAFALQKSRVQLPRNALGFSRLAVLPFEAIADDEMAMQSGLMNSLITNLSKLRQINILPISSVRKFAGQNFDALTAGKEVNADAVLAGTYRIDGENVIVSANLLRVSDGETLWAESFTATGKSEIERETAIALRMGRLLSLKIAEAEEEQSLAGQNLNKEAVQNYLAARKIWRKNELFRRDEMFGLYEKAIALEPNWALAYASFSEALYAAEEVGEEREKVERISSKAIELNPKLPQPYAVLGEVSRWFDWNWEKAETLLKNAIDLDPAYAPAHHRYARLLMLQRRFGEAELEMNKSIEIEPFSPLYYSGLCELHSSDGQFEKALLACLRAKQIEPAHWRVKKLLFWIYVKKEMFSDIDEMFLGHLSPAERAKDPLAKAVDAKNLSSYWRNELERPVTNPDEDSVGSAVFYVQLGEYENALDQLETAFAQHDLTLPTVNTEISFDAIRKEKRFDNLMKKIRLQK